MKMKSEEAERGIHWNLTTDNSVSGNSEITTKSSVSKTFRVITEYNYILSKVTNPLARCSFDWAEMKSGPSVFTMGGGSKPQTNKDMVRLAATGYETRVVLKTKLSNLNRIEIRTRTPLATHWESGWSVHALHSISLLHVKRPEVPEDSDRAVVSYIRLLGFRVRREIFEIFRRSVRVNKPPINIELPANETVEREIDVRSIG